MPSNRQYDEQHWLSFAGWPSLRSSMLKIAAAESGAFLAALADSETDRAEAARAFVERMVRAMNTRFLQGHSSRWSAAISLLGEIELLTQMVETDAGLAGRKHNSDVSPERAFWRMYPMYLNKARQRQGMTTSDRLESWEMIDRMSRRVEAEMAKQGQFPDRLSIAHIEMVRERCQKEWPTSSRVEGSLKRYVGFFQEFSVDRQAEADPDLAGASMEHYRAMARDTEVKPAVRRCLDRLSQHDRSMWDVFLVRHELHPSIAGDFKSYGATNGISVYQLNRTYEQARALIAQCVTTSASFQYRSL